jgi:endoglycosylceramidase
VLLPLLALLLTGLVLGATPGVAQQRTAKASADPAARPRPVGRWLVDGSGRVRIDHGVNMVYKRAPYVPAATGFGDDDAAFLARNGFTSVRLGLIWKAVEPQPGKYDDAYLSRVQRTVNTLHKHGIAALLDFHQDLFNERYQGEGAPDWAVQDDGVPAQPQAGFPGNYFGMAALWRAFDHFWANDPGPGGVGLQDRYAAAWKHVARYFRTTDGVLGIDIFNEPFPGSQWSTCLNPVGCPAFDAQLTAFSQKVIDAVRSVDKLTPVFYEPQLFFNDGVPTYVAPHGSRLGFSFHDYCGTSAIADSYTGCQQTLDTMTFDNAEKQAAAHGVPPLLTEFGATTDQATLKGVTDLAMHYRTGWQYWAYCGCNDPTTTGPGDKQALVFDPAKPPTGANVDHAKLAALVVPHPLLVAGTPTSYGYDRDTRVFTMTWSTSKAGSLPGRFGAGSRTVVSVPRLDYPAGYRVQVTGGKVVYSSTGTLALTQRAGATAVTVKVAPH